MERTIWLAPERLVHGGFMLKERSLLAASMLAGGVLIANGAHAQLIDQSAIRSPWEAACAGQPDAMPLPPDPRSLVVPGVNANPNAAIQFNAFWEDLHNPPAPFVRDATYTPDNPTTCGEYRESANIGEWNLMARQYFQYFIGPVGYNQLWKQWDDSHLDIVERPADFDAQVSSRYGLGRAPWHNPYPKCDQHGNNCEDPATTNGGTGQLPLGLVQGRGVCQGGPLPGSRCDYTGYTGVAGYNTCGVGGTCADVYNGSIAVSCVGCHTNNFLDVNSGFAFNWGRANDDGDAGLLQSDIVLAANLALLELAPIPWSSGRSGSTAAIAITDMLPLLFDMNSLLLAPSILEYFPTGAAGQAKAPHWFHRAHKTRQFWDGGLSSDNVRSEMAFGVANFFRTGTQRRGLAVEFEDIDNFLLSVSPPQYPYAVNMTLAEQGAVLFHERDLWASQVCAGGANLGDACTSNANCPGSTCVSSQYTCDRGANEGMPCSSDADCAGQRCRFGTSPDGIQNDGSGTKVLVSDTCEAGPNAGQACTSDAQCGVQSAAYMVCNDVPNGGTGNPGVPPRGGQVCSTDTNVSASENAFCNAKVCWGGSRNGQLCDNQPSGWCGFLITCGSDILPPNPACSVTVPTVYYRCANPTIPKPVGNGSCASCHGVYAPTYANNTNYLPNPALKGISGVITPIAIIQTDYHRYALMEAERKRRVWNTSFLGYNEQSPNHRGFLNDSLDGLFRSEVFDRAPRLAYDTDATDNVAPHDPVGPNKWRAPTGYVAPPMYGAWSGAPYFHNGSVPTLEAVLAPWMRSKAWKRDFNNGYQMKRYTAFPFWAWSTDNIGYNRAFNPANKADPTNGYDFDKLGWKVTPMTCSDNSNSKVKCTEFTSDQTFDKVPLAAQVTSWLDPLSSVVSLFYQSVPPITQAQLEARRYFNGYLYGNQVVGHRFTQSLTASERAAILEYLKTL